MRNDTDGNGDSPVMGLPPSQNDPIRGPIPSHANQNLFMIMWRHSWIIIGVVVAALVVGFLMLAKTTPLYKSTSKVYVEQRGPKIMGDMEQGFMTGSTNYLYTQAELMKASPILSEVVKKLEPRRLRAFGNAENSGTACRNIPGEMPGFPGNRNGLRAWCVPGVCREKYQTRRYIRPRLCGRSCF